MAGEREYLWPPCSFVQPTGGVGVSVAEGGGVTTVPVRICCNLKALTVCRPGRLAGSGTRTRADADSRPLASICEHVCAHTHTRTRAPAPMPRAPPRHTPHRHEGAREGNTPSGPTRMPAHAIARTHAGTARQVEGLRSQKKDLHVAGARFAVEQVAPLFVQRGTMPRSQPAVDGAIASCMEGEAGRCDSRCCALLCGAAPAGPPPHCRGARSAGPC